MLYKINFEIFLNYNHCKRLSKCAAILCFSLWCSIITKIKHVFDGIMQQIRETLVGAEK